MNKILIKLYVPEIEEEYDVWLPLNKRVHKVTKLLMKAINEFSGGYYKPEKQPLLYDKQTAAAYDVNQRIIETNIRNGSELILI